MNGWRALPGRGNAIFSPASVRGALAMAYVGARGATAQEMARALSLDSEPARAAEALGRTLRDWNAAASNATAAAPPQVRIRNHGWTQQGSAYSAQFLRTLTESFDATFEALDFRTDPSSARRVINAWSDAATEHAIPEIIRRDLDPATSLLLTNAVYFKGSWASPFQQATPAPFHAPTAVVQAQLMQLETSTAYGRLAGARYVKLPFVGRSWFMTVILPDLRGGLERLERTLNVESLERIARFDENSRVRIFLPRFALRSAWSLREPLQSLGMRAAFDANSADFSGIDGTRQLVVSAIEHEARFTIDEAGAEAAAATAVELELAGAPTVEPAVFRADHPFLVLLCDQAGHVLFLGRVVDPTLQR
ncbi:MAG: serpin family protein [Polyangiaceae bacterium]